MGVILDKLARFRYLILASTLLVMGVTNAFLPYCPSLLAMYICVFIGGFGSGSLDTGGNVLLLDIWKGRDSGPYMHALHFTFGIGAFLAPVISRPFLVNEADVENLPVESEVTLENSTYQSLEVRSKIESSTWTIKDLYPMVGSYPILISFLFFFYFVKDSRKASEQSKETDESNGKKENVEKLKFKIVTVGLVAIFFFLYVGMEVAFGTFVSVFAVESKLKFT